MRLQKMIADSGLCSRRKAEELIIKGSVKINNKIAKIGDTATHSDTILVNNKKLKFQKKIYIVLNKPRNYLCSNKSEGNKRTVFDLLKIKERIYTVGRLDYETEGLILLTNDGIFKEKISHPRFNVNKTYRVFLNKKISSKDIAKISSGIVLDNKKLNIINIKTHATNYVDITIHEGRKHIIRRLFSSLNYDVMRLIRISIGNLKLNNLKKGEWRHLKKKEINDLIPSYLT